MAHSHGAVTLMQVLARVRTHVRTHVPTHVRTHAHPNVATPVYTPASAVTLPRVLLLFIVYGLCSYGLRGNGLHSYG